MPNSRKGGTKASLSRPMVLNANHICGPITTYFSTTDPWGAEGEVKEEEEGEIPAYLPRMERWEQAFGGPETASKKNCLKVQ